MLKPNRLHHIAIICSDYAVSKRFYTEALGLKVLQEVYRAERKSYKLDLEVGGLYQIELFLFLIRLKGFPALRLLVCAI